MRGNAKRDLILVASVVLVAAALFCAFRVSRGEGSVIEITVDGKVYGTYPLDGDREINVDGRLVVSIKDGRASVVSSSCRGGDCVRERAISRAGETIVCLPGAVIIRVTGGGEVDARV